MTQLVRHFDLRLGVNVNVIALFYLFFVVFWVGN